MVFENNLTQKVTHNLRRLADCPCGEKSFGKREGIVYTVTHGEPPTEAVLVLDAGNSYDWNIDRSEEHFSGESFMFGALQLSNNCFVCFWFGMIHVKRKEFGFLVGGEEFFEDHRKRFEATLERLYMFSAEEATP